jgi:hypothetical protein
MGRDLVRGLDRLWHSEHFRKLQELQLEYARAQPDGRVAMFITVKAANITGMNAETRRQVSERSRAMDGHLRAAAVVVADGGFNASIIRSVVAAVNLVRQSDYPTKVFSNVEDAAAWLADQMPRNPAAPTTAADICRAHAMIRGAESS